MVPCLALTSITLVPSNTGSPTFILGLPHPPSTPVAEYPGMLELHRQSRDYPGITSPPSTPVAEYPGMLELHQQSRDYPGTTSPPAPLRQGIPAVFQELVYIQLADNNRQWDEPKQTSCDAYKHSCTLNSPAPPQLFSGTWHYANEKPGNKATLNRNWKFTEHITADYRVSLK